MRAHRRTTHWLSIAALLLALGAGPNRTYFPLDQGNRWHVVGEARMETRDLAGATLSETTVHDDYLRAIDGTEDRFGHTYTIQRELLTETIEGTSDESTTWIRYRQDGDGLYEADVANTTPPGGETPALLASGGATSHAALTDRLVRSVPEASRAAYRAAWERLHARVELIRQAARGWSATRGPSTARASTSTRVEVADANELTRLRYPLHPGQTWQIRPDPLFTSEVEAAEALAVPAGHFPTSRIRIESILFGPHDQVHLWMSRSGQIALAYHLEADVTDQNGNVSGTTTLDYREELQDLDLAAR